MFRLIVLILLNNSFINYLWNKFMVMLHYIIFVIFLQGVRGILYNFINSKLMLKENK